MASDTLGTDDPRAEVVRPGLETTIQDWPGRTGLWSVGVPPSGPMDELSFRLGNRALGNDEGAAGLEVSMGDLALRFPSGAVIVVTGAPTSVQVDSRPVPQWHPLTVPAGALLELGSPVVGTHSYVLVVGGLSTPGPLGSATATTGELGAPLRAGDVLPLSRVDGRVTAAVPPEHRPEFGRAWRLGVLEGPHGAPDFFTRSDVEAFYDTVWTVHPQSSRAGIRLSGPPPTWARRDGGDAGLHPSAIHDTPYAVGAVAFRGDTPVIIGPDGPTLGRSTCPVTVVAAHRWKLGQLRPGDTVRFIPVTDLQADDLRRQPPRGFPVGREPVVDGGVLLRLAATRDRPRATFRRHGDDNLLVEYGEMTLDLSLRMRVQALSDAVARQVETGGLVGVLDLSPGIRSLQLHVDPARVRVPELLGVVRALDDALPPSRDLVVPSRTVRLPLCWDDPAVEETAARQLTEIRADAPWCPGPVDFIRRLNGLDAPAEVARIVLAAEYLVLGLGDGARGAPIATPLDPRHRLMTFAVDPPREWTPAGAVGLNGPYLGVHTLAGPGSDLLIGRTVPLWSASGGPDPTGYGPTSPPAPGLRCFDRIRWLPVSPEELAELAAGLAAGTAELDVTDGSFAMADHDRFIAEHTDAIAEFVHHQSSAFAAERRAWQRGTESERGAVARAAGSRRLGDQPEAL